MEYQISCESTREPNKHSEDNRRGYSTNSSINTKLQISLWRTAQTIGLAASVSIITGLLIQPQETLFIVWHVIVPVIPLLLFVTPGIWRNVCPIATVSQYPRLLEIARPKRVPKWLTMYSGMFSIVLFFLLVSSRKIALDHNATLLAGLLLAMMLLATIMGQRYKGKSGWCTSICPINPIERLYGQTPFFTIKDRHCQPCVSCTKQCYDATPNTAYLASLHSRKSNQNRSAADLKLFASILPGFILAFYLVPNPSDLSIIEISKMYSYFLLFCLVNAGIFYILVHALSIGSGKIITLHGAAALNIYYWFNAPTISELFPTDAELVVCWSLRILIAALSIAWVYRTYRKERIFLDKKKVHHSASIQNTLSR